MRKSTEKKYFVLFCSVALCFGPSATGLGDESNNMPVPYETSLDNGQTKTSPHTAGEQPGLTQKLNSRRALVIGSGGILALYGYLQSLDEQTKGDEAYKKYSRAQTQEDAQKHRSKVKDHDSAKELNVTLALVGVLLSSYGYFSEAPWLEEKIHIPSENSEKSTPKISFIPHLSGDQLGGHLRLSFNIK